MTAHRADVQGVRLAERLRVDQSRAEARVAEAQQYLSAVQLAVALAEQVDQLGGEVLQLRSDLEAVTAERDRLQRLGAGRRLREAAGLPRADAGLT